MSPFNFDAVLTTGASGMIGAYVDFGLRPDHHTLDILNEEAVMQYVVEHQPNAIIHLVGAVDTQRCENEPLYAYELNVRGTYNVACAAREVGAMMVYVSTSRVFKGDKMTPYTEEDIPEPETHYGRTKYMGELITAAIMPRHIIARTAWVFGGGPKLDNKFFGKVLTQLGAGDEVVALDDVRGSPTYAKDYIAAIKELLTKEEYGTFHIANTGDATRYDIAIAMATQLNTRAKVRAVDRSFFPSGNMLPTNESIVSERCILRPWKEALTDYVMNEWA